MATKKKTAQKKTQASKSVKKPVARKAPARPPVKKPAAKTTAAKKAAKKPVPKPVAKKIAPPKKAKKPVAKKVVLKKAVKKPVVKKAAPKKAAPVRKPVAKAPARPAAPASKPAAKARPPRAFRKEELAAFRVQLQQALELVQGNLNALAGDNLKRSPLDATGDISSHSTHMADHGTDNFDRELALNLASSRQDSLYDIEDALRRIDDATYGACEACGCAIELPRLKALPFAKKCMACQNAAERGRTKYRPFGGTLPLQQLATEDASGDSPDSMG
jgi:RNA polymerase-binding transcription factor DksA